MDAPLVPAQSGTRVWEANSTAVVERQWAAALSADEIAAISSAADEVVRHSTPQQINQDAVNEFATSLAASAVAERMRRVADVLLNGVGFAVLSAFPVAEWGRAKSAAAFLLLSRLLGPLRMQNAAGHLLGHVRDLGLSSTDPSVRVYQTCERQTFHTDSCDVVGLLCLQRAQSGGSSTVVSVGAIFNRMRSARPDLLALLMRPIATDRRGEVPPGGLPYFTTPVLSLHDGGLLSVMYQRQYIDSAQRFPGAPRLTPAHVEALDLFDALANDPSLQCTMELAPGDLQFAYNHVLLHDRSAFVDHHEPPRRRHLLRAWIAANGARPLPDSFAERFGSVAVGARGGVSLDGIVAPVALLLAPGEEASPAVGATSKV